MLYGLMSSCLTGHSDADGGGGVVGFLCIGHSGGGSFDMSNFWWDAGCCSGVIILVATISAADTVLPMLG